MITKSLKIHHNLDICRVNPILVECHGVQQGVMGTKAASGEACCVDGTDGGQGTVWAVLDIGFDVVQRGGGTVAGAGRKD